MRKYTLFPIVTTRLFIIIIIKYTEFSELRGKLLGFDQTGSSNRTCMYVRMIDTEVAKAKWRAATEIVRRDYFSRINHISDIQSFNFAVGTVATSHSFRSTRVRQRTKHLCSSLVRTKRFRSFGDSLKRAGSRDEINSFSSLAKGGAYRREIFETVSRLTSLYTSLPAMRTTPR